MSIQSLARFTSATQNISDKVKNIQAIQAARQKQAQENETFELNKKKTELEIEGLRQSGQVSKIQADIMKSLFDQEIGQMKKVQGGKEATIDIAEHQELSSLDKLKEVVMGTIDDPDVQAIMGVASGTVSGMETTEKGRSMLSNVNPGIARRSTPEMEGESFLSQYAPGITGEGKPGFRKKTDEEQFRGTLQQLNAGKISMPDAVKRFPDKAKQIRQARIETFSPRTRSIITQIEEAVNASTQEIAKGSLSALPPDQIVQQLLGDLLEREDEARKKGIDVDQILEMTGYSKEELMQGLKGKKKGILSSITGMFKGE